MGSAAVLPGVRSNRALARSLLADARDPIRDQVGSLAGELHQYLGWLLVATGHTKQARAEYDAALALGVEIDDPDLTSLALSYKGHLAWMLDDPRGTIALSRGARRDLRVFVGQQAYNAHQEARGWAMTSDPAAVDRTLGQADKLAVAGQAERAVAQARQALAVCRTTKSTQLAHALHHAHTRMRDVWPTYPPVRELGDELRPLSGAR